ncbi:MAG TPA: hypothetical protein PLI94_07130 [Bacillota bacterium]|mgnify:CR=1 FL=1|nr:hypothetical protein [Bacillota bacterium]
MRKFRLLVLSGLILLFPMVTLAEPCRLNPVTQVNEVFNQLEQAYMKEDLKLFLKFHHKPLVGADMVRKATFLFTGEMLAEEMKYVFDNFSGIRLRFDQREIQVVGDTTYVTTVRVFSAAGLPEYHVRLTFALKRSFPMWGGRWQWEITDQILVEEWVAEEAGLCAPGPGTRLGKRRSLFW